MSGIDNDFHNAIAHTFYKVDGLVARKLDPSEVRARVRNVVEGNEDYSPCQGFTKKRRQEVYEAVCQRFGVPPHVRNGKENQ